MSQNRADDVSYVASELKSAAAQAGAAIHGTARRIGAETSDLGEQAYQQGARGAKYVTRNVEAQPLVALALAASIGFLVGLFVRRES